MKKKFEIIQGKREYRKCKNVAKSEMMNTSINKLILIIKKN